MTHLLTLSLTNFRNYAHARLSLDARPLVLVGHNGAGKTNLLEAVSFLAPGRGMRRAKLSEVDRQGGGAWAVAATLETPLGEVQIGTGRAASAEASAKAESGAISESDKRLVRINGAPARGANALAEYLSLVWLTPENDKLFLEGHSARRRFLDRLVYGFDAAHAERVAAYEYAMRERNRLLSFGITRADPHWLDTLERKLAETATAIAHARLETASHLNASMRDANLSFPAGELALRGFAEERLSAGGKAQPVEQALAEMLRGARAADAESGRTSLGAHKTELSVTHVRKNMEAAFCSTGEQKALLLSIALAEARAGAVWKGRVPLLLLDEVAAHLDAGKRLELFEEIQSLGVQAWMTGTEAELFAGLRGVAQFMEVANGHVSPLREAVD